MIDQHDTILAQMFDSSPAGMSLTIGPEHTYARVNKKFYEITGAQASVIGKTAREVLPEIEEQGYLGIIDLVYQTGKAHTGVEAAFSFRKSTGEYCDVYFDFCFQPLFNADGEVYGILTQVCDVTEKVQARMAIEESKKFIDHTSGKFPDIDLRQLLHKLQTAKEEAERASNLKSAFLAYMSHEIRTPLGAMLGFADLLLDPHITREEHSNYLEILIRNGEQLSIIVNDILDLSKVEAGHLTLEFMAVDPRSIVMDVLSLLEIKAREKNLPLSFDADSNTPEYVCTDPHRVRQVLLNLMSNAIKFTHHGSIQVRSYRLQTEGAHIQMAFEITDTGIGIDPTQVEQIFEMFVQAEESTTRKFGGTGLGLALSRKLAHALGGDVRVLRSKPGEGSTFLFTLTDRPDLREKNEPLSYEPPMMAPALADGESLYGLKILVVDDAPDIRSFKAVNKRQTGFCVLSASHLRLAAQILSRKTMIL